MDGALRGASGSGDRAAGLKRSRACESCRHLKVRCEPSSDHQTDACRRCSKTKRPCIVAKSDPTPEAEENGSRVERLEKKIDALTQALNASLSTPQVAVPSPTYLGLQGMPRGGTTSDAEASRVQFSNETWNGDRPGDGPNIMETESSHASSRGFYRQSGNLQRPADVVDRGIVDWQTSERAFFRFTDCLLPSMPIIVFSRGTKPGDVRQFQPTLFLVILLIAIGPLKPEAQSPLLREVHHVFAEKVIIQTERSLELFQALLLYCLWYVPPSEWRSVKISQFLHVAISMALDMGIGWQTWGKGSHEQGVFKAIVRKKIFLSDPDSPETRRAWLGCYYLDSAMSMVWRRPHQIQWNRYMDECIHILQNSPDALPSDQLLIHYVKLLRIADDVWFQFAADNFPSEMFNDAMVRFWLRSFQDRLDQWHGVVSQEELSRM